MHVRTGLGITKNRIEEWWRLIGNMVGSSLDSNGIASNFSNQMGAVGPMLDHGFNSASAAPGTRRQTFILRHACGAMVLGEWIMAVNVGGNLDQA